jgi:hypothetical protein
LRATHNDDGSAADVVVCSRPTQTGATLEPTLDVVRRYATPPFTRFATRERLAECV